MNTRLAELPRHPGDALSWLAVAHRGHAFTAACAGATLVWLLWTLAGLDAGALLWQGALAALIFMAGTRHAHQNARRELQRSQRALAEAGHDLRQPAHAMALYQQLIEQLDVPTAQVEIEAMIVDISTDRASELGVSWSGRVGRLDFSLGRQSELTAASNSARAGNFLMAQLRALETKGDAEIMSRPSVLTSDNMAALLDLSETFYIRSQGERVANVTPVTAGTTLRVTPHVAQLDGKTLVQMKIDIEDGRVTGRQVDSLPTVGRMSISTEATVDNGDALLIAGYVSSNNLASRDQVPVLGDIPGVGVLFSANTRTVQKRERMFLIRPRVVGWPGQAALPLPVATQPTPRAPGAQ